MDAIETAARWVTANPLVSLALIVVLAGIYRLARGLREDSRRRKAQALRLRTPEEAARFQVRTLDYSPKPYRRDRTPKA